MAFWRRHHPEPTRDDLFLVVGLGNPGAQYARTRHNIGFMVVETLARRHELRFKGSKLRADVARGEIDGISVLIALPLTYMNESGIAVSRLTNYYKIPIERLIVVCDDLDLPFGTLRARPNGSSGGNNGLESIIQSLGTREFARIRLGVGRPRGRAIGHVLGSFPPDEENQLPGLLEIAADATEYWLRHGTQPAMNQFNRDWLPELTAP